MNFDNDGSCSPVARTRSARDAALNTTTALEVQEESMEDGSTAVALPFRLGNSLCENRPMEVTRLKLMTDTSASFQLDPSDEAEAAPAVAEESEADASKGALDDSLVSASPDTELLGAVVAHASDEDDDTGSVGPEPSVASDTSSLAGSLDDLGSFDVGFELAISGSMDVDAVKTFEILAAPVVEELRVDVLGIGVEYDHVKGLASVEPMEVQETRAAGPRSLFLKDCVPLWGSVSICGRRPEMEDAVVAVPRFFDIPLWMLISDRAADGLAPSKISSPSHFFGVYDGHGGAQVANYCQERIHLALADKLASSKEGLEGNGGGSDLQKQWERAFNDCFLKVDAEVGGKVSRACLGTTSEASDPVAPETVGSTAVVSVICSSHIIVANCGDSRAVLCRGKQALPLSVDHKPNREDEYARIEAAGGKVIQWNGYRVFGVLAMSRSIGVSAAMNDLRPCAPLSLKHLIAQELVNGLQTVSNSLIHYNAVRVLRGNESSLFLSLCQAFIEVAFPYCATCLGRCYPNGAALITERRSLLDGVSQLLTVSSIKGFKKSSDIAEATKAAENGDAVIEAKSAIVDGEVLSNANVGQSSSETKPESQSSS